MSLTPSLPSSFQLASDEVHSSCASLDVPPETSARLYRVSSVSQDATTLLVPRVVMRTAEVTRAIVQIEMPEEAAQRIVEINRLFRWKPGYGHPPEARSDARSGKRIVERRGRDDLPIKCRLARRRDDAANFASRSPGIGTGNIEAKGLDDLSGGRICRAVVGTIPAWIRVVFLGSQQ